MATSGNGRGIELGLVLPFYTQPGALQDGVRLADEGGIDSIWVTDRTTSPGRIPWYEPIAALGVLAGLTSRAKIGTSVLVPARRNPVLTAHSLASLQEITGGRVVAGFGIGGLEPRDFTMCGVECRDRAAITEEYIGVMRRLWNEPEVTHQGTHYQCEEVYIRPQPQTPIPIWVGGGTPAAMNRAARLGDGWLSIFAPPEYFPQAWQGVQQQAVEAGRDPAAITPAAYVFTSIAKSDAAAEEKLRPQAENLFGAPLEAVSAACFWGDPTTWAERIEAFETAGVKALNVVLMTDDLVKDVELILEEVLPQLGRRSS